MAEGSDNNIAIGRDALVTLAVETWRLARAVDGGAISAVSLRYSLRKQLAALASSGVEFIDLEGREYDEGLAVEVLDTEGDGDGTRRVKEMLAPIVMVGGKTVASGQVILQRDATSSATGASEATCSDGATDSPDGAGTASEQGPSDSAVTTDAADTAGETGTADTHEPNETNEGAQQ